MDHCELHHREEEDREFLEPRADPTAVLQPADRQLDDAATPVGLLVERRAAVMSEPLVFPSRDQRLAAGLPKPVPQLNVVMAFVTRQSLRPLWSWVRRLAEMRENLPDGPWLSDEGDQADVATAPRALGWKLLTHLGHDGPLPFSVPLLMRELGNSPCGLSEGGA